MAEVLTLLLLCQYKSTSTDTKGAAKAAGKDTAVMDQILQDCLNLLLQGVYIRMYTAYIYGALRLVSLLPKYYLFIYHLYISPTYVCM